MLQYDKGMGGANNALKVQKAIWAIGVMMGDQPLLVALLWPHCSTTTHKQNHLLIDEGKQLMHGVRQHTKNKMSQKESLANPLSINMHQHTCCSRQCWQY